MQNLNFNNNYNDFSNQLPKGVFLTVKDEEKINTMTIAWGFTGVMWFKPTMVVAVRYSRYTYDLIEKAEDFTVSVPLNSNLKNSLKICGTLSGRDHDKFKEANLSIESSKSVKSPIIKECDLFFECKKMYKQAMDPNSIIDNKINEKYLDGDYHVFYYGEILESYRK